MGKNCSANEFLTWNEETQTYELSADQLVRDEVEKRHWNQVLANILKDWRLYLMLVPMILVFFLWKYMPMYELLSCFKYYDTSKAVADQYFVGFSSFNQLLTGGYSAEFWRAFRNTFMISFYSLCFGFPVPIILALFFNEVRSNIARSVFQVATYLPKFMSTVVITTLVTLLLQGQSLVESPGVIAQLLCKLGLITEEAMNYGLLNSPVYFRSIYLISGIWETAGYSSIVFFAAVIAISPTSYEAAQIDGAGKLAQMRYVVLPSILSTVLIMLIVNIGSLLMIGFEKVLLLYNNSTYMTADVVSTFAARLGGISGAAGGSESIYMGIASASEMLNNVIGMILVIGANVISRKASEVSLY